MTDEKLNMFVALLLDEDHLFKFERNVIADAIRALMAERNSLRARAERAETALREIEGLWNRGSHYPRDFYEVACNYFAPKEHGDE